MCLNNHFIARPFCSCPNCCALAPPAIANYSMRELISALQDARAFDNVNDEATVALDGGQFAPDKGAN